MSFIGGGFGLGAGPSNATRFASTRGRIQGSPVQGVNYPSPFFDVAHTYLPVTVKQMFRWCRYYFLTNPLINATVFKLSEYPVTDLIIEHEDPEVVEKWTDYFQGSLNYRPFQIETGLDYHCYGNSAVSIGFPFKKYVHCSNCGFNEQAKKIRGRWTFTNYTFRLSCPACGTIADAWPEDRYFKNASGVKLLRWNCEHIEITYNDITGESTYFYTIPPTIRNDIVIGKKDVVESTPQIFIQALRQQKGIVFSKDNFFHFKRPTLAQQDRGWGIPLILPVLKDTFYLQLMKKAQECVAPSTLLETSRGLIQAAEVKVGDLVRTHTGNYQPVAQREIRPMVEERGDYAVELTVSGLRQMPSTFSNNHPLWVLRRNDTNRRTDSKEHRRSSYVLRNPSLYDFKWVEAGSVSVGDYVGYPTARHCETQVVDVSRYAQMVATDEYVYSGVSVSTAKAFEELEQGNHVQHNNAGRVAKRLVKKEAEPKRLRRHLELDEDLAYVAGWYLGDGSIGARRVDFSMGPDDDGIELQAAIERVFGATFANYPSRTSRGWMLCAFDTIFSEFMAGWIPGHAATKRIPEEILTAPDDVVLAFLRGYLEADGYTELSIRNSETIAVCCSNKQLTYQLWSLLLSLGCISTLAETQSYETEIEKLDGSVQTLSAGRPVFQWAVKSRSARRLSQLLAGEVAESVVSGKSGFFVHGYFAARISETHVIDCPEVISFEVAGDHTFCVPGMATHNTILLEHIVPMRILFPQAASGSSDPFTSINLVDWRDQIAAEIARWRYDNNYIPILPLPVGNQSLGGDGRALLLTSEIQEWSTQIMVGMGVPREFLLGGMSYAGTNVSMRMLENQFLGFIMRHRAMAKWVMKMIAAYMDWPEVDIRFKPFKMADDLQRKAYLFQLNQAQKISDRTLLADTDLDQKEEDEIMVQETSSRLVATKKQQLGMAEIQAEAQVIMAKSQVKAQQVQVEAQQAPQAPGEPGITGSQSQLNMGQRMGMAPAPNAVAASEQQAAGGKAPPEAQGVDLTQMAQQLAQQIMTMGPGDREVAYQNLEAQSHELAQLVRQFVTQQEGAGGGAGKPDTVAGVDMRAMPKKLPPRRDTAMI